MPRSQSDVDGSNAEASRSPPNTEPAAATTRRRVSSSEVPVAASVARTVASFRIDANAHRSVFATRAIPASRASTRARPVSVASSRSSFASSSAGTKIATSTTAASVLAASAASKVLAFLLHRDQNMAHARATCASSRTSTVTTRASTPRWAAATTASRNADARSSPTQAVSSSPSTSAAIDAAAGLPSSTSARASTTTRFRVAGLGVSAGGASGTRATRGAPRSFRRRSRTAAFAASRNRVLSTFPEPPVGNASTTSSTAGTLYAESTFRACAMSVSAEGSRRTARSGLSTTAACTISPSTSFSTPKTAACFTSGCACNAASTSAVYTFSPPTRIMSVLRSTTVRYPSSSIVARSPVLNQSPSNARDVASGSRQYPSKTVGPRH